MDHLYRSKPHFQTIVEKQRLAHYRLTKDQTTRTEPERANYERSLRPVPMIDLELPKLPLARLRQDASRQFVVLGECAQRPNTFVVLDIGSGMLGGLMDADLLELLPPDSLASKK